ncbi:enoyl-CoA hydratase [Nitratireductor sp. XY-223]|uniref:enoyl-CoA hydratase n=1 Tax=Nitratireductor sp. XY-223 TaxID=2561926 RepID=UPI0010AAFC44|nr:enoyl-CoA hydratase [Nitratireductor sp. XY-223]
MTEKVIETGTPTLICSVSNRVATIAFNYPEKKNAMAREMMSALGETLTRIESDSDIRTVVLTGKGGAFCSGGDVGGMGSALGGGREPDAEALIAHIRKSQTAGTFRIYEFPKPVIAALPGAAAGAGMSLALACDIRVCAESGFLLPAFGKIGLSGDHGGSWLLSRLVGPGRAREIYFTNRRILPDEGLALGLFNQVVPDEELVSATKELAEKIAGFAPLALRYMKENHNRAGFCDFRTALDWEADRMIRTMLSEDHREGVRAFAEKRPPEFGKH